MGSGSMTPAPSTIRMGRCAQEATAIHPCLVETSRPGPKMEIAMVEVSMMLQLATI